jgi:hypothetical protein
MSGAKSIEEGQIATDKSAIKGSNVVMVLFKTLIIPFVGTLVLVSIFLFPYKLDTNIITIDRGKGTVNAKSSSPRFYLIPIFLLNTESDGIQIKGPTEKDLLTNINSTPNTVVGFGVKSDFYGNKKSEKIYGTEYWLLYNALPSISLAFILFLWFNIKWIFKKK